MHANFSFTNAQVFVRLASVAPIILCSNITIINDLCTKFTNLIKTAPIFSVVNSRLPFRYFCAVLEEIAVPFKSAIVQRGMHAVFYRWIVTSQLRSHSGWVNQLRRESESSGARPAVPGFLSGPAYFVQILYVYDIKSKIKSKSKNLVSHKNLSKHWSLPLWRT